MSRIGQHPQRSPRVSIPAVVAGDTASATRRIAWKASSCLRSGPPWTNLHQACISDARTLADPGSSKSSNGALSLILRTGVASSRRVGTRLVDFTDMSAFPGMVRPTVVRRANFDNCENSRWWRRTAAIQTEQSPVDRGDPRSWTAADPVFLDSQMVNRQRFATRFVAGSGTVMHSWNSGWLDGAVTCWLARGDLLAARAIW